MSLDTFLVFHPDTNQWVPACDSYLVDTRKLSDEEHNHLYNRSNTNTEEILNKYGMTLDSCEYHKIMEDAEKVEATMTQQPQKAMTQQLSADTIQKLADVLTDDAIKYLETDEEVIETLVSVIGRFLTDRMGQMDDTLLNELSFIIFDNFDIVSNNK
jgi:hypothetical protein